MSYAGDLFEAMGETVEDNTSDAGIDIVNVLSIWIEAMSQDPTMTVERWEDFKLSIRNMSAMVDNMVDEKIKQLQINEETK